MAMSNNDDYSMKVFVGSIDFNVTEKEVEDAFKPYGEVTNTIILRDRETNKSRGFGFVTFKDKESVKNAIEGMNHQPIRGRPIIVNYASKKSTGGGAGAGAGAGAGKQTAYPDAQNQGYGGYAQQQQQYYQGQGYGWNQANYGWNQGQGQGYWPQPYGAQWSQQNWAQQQQPASQTSMGSNGYPNQQYATQQYSNMNYGGNSGSGY